MAWSAAIDASRLIWLGYVVVQGVAALVRVGLLVAGLCCLRSTARRGGHGRFHASNGRWRIDLEV